MRALFLNAGLEESRRIIDPPLFMVEDEQRLHQVPLEDLALQSDKVLLLDHHTDVSFMQSHILMTLQRYLYGADEKLQTKSLTTSESIAYNMRHK
jgi:hypothetical protein